MPSASSWPHPSQWATSPNWVDKFHFKFMFSDLKLSLRHSSQARVSPAASLPTPRRFHTFFSASDTPHPVLHPRSQGWPASHFMEQMGALGGTQASPTAPCLLHGLLFSSPGEGASLSPSALRGPIPPLEQELHLSPLKARLLCGSILSAPTWPEFHLKYMLPLPTASHVSVPFFCFLNSQLLEKVVQP